jgi:hypothetical protein
MNKLDELLYLLQQLDVSENTCLLRSANSLASQILLAKDGQCRDMLYEVLRCCGYELTCGVPDIFGIGWAYGIIKTRNCVVTFG